MNSDYSTATRFKTSIRIHVTLAWLVFITILTRRFRRNGAVPAVLKSRSSASNCKLISQIYGDHTLDLL